MEAERQVVIALLELLKVLGIDQRTIAARLGVTQSRVSHWKSGFRPIAKHQLDALSQLLHEAHEQDLRRDEDATPHLKTPKELERWRLHKLARDEAFKAFQVSHHRWMEQVSPGASLEYLSHKAESLWQIMTSYMNQGVTSLTLVDRVLLSVTVGDFKETLRLMNVMEPPTWGSPEQFEADTQAAIDRFAEIKGRKEEERKGDAKNA